MHSVKFGLLSALLFSSLAAQTPVPHPLSDYAGTYAYSPGRNLEIVVGDELFAVLDGARYNLRPAGTDKFTNPSGVTIPFRRDPIGNIIGLEESGQFRPRISSTVTPESAALAHPHEDSQFLEPVIHLSFE